MIRTLVLSATLLCAAWASAAEIDDHAEREQIRQRRATVEARHAEHEAECRKRFAVTACLDKARLERHDALGALRQQELALDDAQRRQRAEGQARRLEDKARKSERPQAEPVRAASRPRTPPEPRPAKAPKPAPPDRSADEKAARERFEARQQEIRAHREEVEKRNAAKKPAKPPTPLPLPPGASAP